MAAPVSTTAAESATTGASPNPAGEPAGYTTGVVEPHDASYTPLPQVSAVANNEPVRSAVNFTAIDAVLSTPTSEVKAHVEPSEEVASNLIAVAPTSTTSIDNVFGSQDQKASSESLIDGGQGPEVTESNITTQVGPSNESASEHLSDLEVTDPAPVQNIIAASTVDNYRASEENDRLPAHETPIRRSDDSGTRGSQTPDQSIPWKQHNSSVADKTDRESASLPPASNNSDSGSAFTIPSFEASDSNFDSPQRIAEIFADPDQFEMRADQDRPKIDDVRVDVARAEEDELESLRCWKEREARRVMNTLIADHATRKDLRLFVEEETRMRYIVRKGDTLESIAEKILHDRRLALLIFRINRPVIKVEYKEGKQIIHLKVNTVLQLPTRTEIELFRATLSSKRLNNKEAVAVTTRIDYTVRLGDNLRSVATKHAALKDVTLWPLVAEINGLTTEVDSTGSPVARIQRGTTLRLPSTEEITRFRARQNTPVSNAV